MAEREWYAEAVTLELGGNDPAIVLDDANLETITPNLFRGAFLNAGQICMAVKRIYAPDHLYEPLVEGLTRLARAHRVGDGMDPESEMGPLQNKMQFDKVIGRHRGYADATSGPASPPAGTNSTGRAISLRRPWSPTATDDMRIVAEGTVRPGPAGPEIQRPRRRGAPRQRHALRPRRLGVDRGL